MDVNQKFYVEGLEKSFVDNTDPFTHHVGDWEGNIQQSSKKYFETSIAETFVCEDTPVRSIVEETTFPSKYYSQIFGNQFQRKLDCVSGYEYSVKKYVSIQHNKPIRSNTFGNKYR